MKSIHMPFLLLLFVAASGLGILGCTSLESIVPLVTEEMFIGEVTTNSIPTDLQNGRDIYINSCARCHRMVGIDQHTPQKWSEILPRMSELSKLTPQGSSQLESYVLFMSTRMQQSDYH